MKSPGLSQPNSRCRNGAVICSCGELIGKKNARSHAHAAHVHLHHHVLRKTMQLHNGVLPSDQCSSQELGMIVARLSGVVNKKSQHDLGTSHKMARIAPYSQVFQISGQ